MIVMKTDSYDNLTGFIESRPSTWKEEIAAAPYFVSVKKHPDLPYYKLKYSQFESPFDDPVVRCCRGSVVEVTGGRVRMVQAPYFKFCNRGETRGEDEITFPAYAIDKLDGSLVVLSVQDGVPLWTTSGSFAIGTECPDNYDGETEPETLGLKTFEDLVEYSLDKYGRGWVAGVPNGWTLMFEILSPRNRIIVKNTSTRLVLHGARSPDLVEVEPEYARDLFGVPFEVPEKTRVSSWEEVEEILASKYTSGVEREGLVIRSDDWSRVKIKSDPYRALKFVKGEDNFNDKRIYEAVLSGDADDAVAAWPEIRGRVEATKKRLEGVYDSVRSAVRLGNETFAAAFLETRDKRAAKKVVASLAFTKPEFTRPWLFAGADLDVESGFKKAVGPGFSYEKFRGVCDEIGV